MPKIKKIVIAKKKLTKYWEELQLEELRFSAKVIEIERRMAAETGIKDIEFFSCDGAYVGVGNASRTMKLIQIR